jgi:phosphohistidine swiveling domain-containing protein
MRTLDDLPADVGGKARQLARLHAAGLPVPESAVLPASVFVEALAAAGLLDRARSVAAGAIDEGLAHAVRSMVLPEATRRAWVDAAARLGSRLAVRSSGIDEDGAERSFAGQHETMLNVAPEGVPDAVLACWASLYNLRARVYRGGAGPAPGSLAVLVQRQLDPRAAGVMFTINPLNGSWREMVVEAVWGLGEGLVSGQLNPHGYLVRRPRPLPEGAPELVGRVAARVRLRVVQRDLPDLDQRVVADAAGGTCFAPVPAAWRGKPTLDDHQLERLCRLGLHVERLLGEPQDVEWADEHGRLVLLQARPITAAGTPRTRDDVIWTRRFIGERWPEPATPLGWSLLQPVLDHFIAYPATQAAHLGGGPALRLVDGRPMINATVFRHLAFKLPGAPPPRFMLELLPPEEERAWRQRFAVPPNPAVYASILRTTVAERRWERFHWNPLTNPAAWEAFRERLQAALPSLRHQPQGAEARLAKVDEQLRWITDYCSIHVCSLLFANIAYQLLEGALASWAPERALDAMAVLATSPPGNLTVATHHALERLAAAAGPGDLDRLADGQVAGTFATALEGFLATWGHRAESSWEIMAPHWSDDPRQLAPLLRGAHRPPPAPVTDEAVRAALRALDPSLTVAQRATVRGLVYYTRRYLLLRENQRFWFDHLLSATRQMLLGLGADLAAAGHLAALGDVAYLPWATVRDAALGRAPPALAERAAAARALWVAQQHKAPVSFLVGDEPVSAATEGRRLQGLGISGGRHRGKVRVLHRVADGERLRDGEVLVTRAVDPGWTPLFARAGAVVLELGSVLSHGAVVAREYGIPAVVNLEGVTTRLVDGADVTVDGTRGTVWVHSG